jgi:hypothetical protein
VLLANQQLFFIGAFSVAGIILKGAAVSKGATDAAEDVFIQQSLK